MDPTISREDNHKEVNIMDVPIIPIIYPHVTLHSVWNLCSSRGVRMCIKNEFLAHY